MDFRRSAALADQVVDRGLIGLQVGDVLLEASADRRLLRGRKARQRQQLVAPLVILVDALLEDAAERLPDLGEAFRVLVREGLQLGDDPAGDGLADLRHLRVVLQHLARDVERQVLAVDHAAHEAQIRGQQSASSVM